MDNMNMYIHNMYFQNRYCTVYTLSELLKKSVFAQPVASTRLFDKYVCMYSRKLFFFTGIKAELSTVGIFDFRIIDALPYL